MEDHVVSAASEETASELVWKARVLDAQTFEGTLAEYCERHGLNPRQLRRYKKKFGATRTYRRRSAKAFVKVECEQAPQAEPETAARERRPSELPEPRWLADFITALAGQR